MRRRINTVDWQTCQVAHRFASDFQDACIRWQSYTMREQDGMVIPIQHRKDVRMQGDQGVIIAAINLRNYLDGIILKSKEANREVMDYE